jgi:cobalt-zinc-cadmium resistance protein CzcA
MDRELNRFPGVNWNFSQPISDNVEEAVSGVKGELAVKLFGTDLKILEAKANEIQEVMTKVPGVTDLGYISGTRSAKRQPGCRSHRCRSLRDQRQ